MKMKPKQRKSFTLSEPVVAWLNKEEKSSGTPVSRIVQAAIVCYAEMDAQGRQEVMGASMDVAAGRRSI